MAVEFDFSDLDEFVKKLGSAARGDFKAELVKFMQGLATDFLRIVQDEIIRRKVVDSRLLLASFHQSGEDNVWEISDDGLTLEVGTAVKYAQIANDGHCTVKENTPGAYRTKKDGKKIPAGTLVRFVPGYWSGNRFVYDRNAKTGMVLKQQWIEGKHYWEGAIRILEKMFPEVLDKKVQEWLDKYFRMGA